MVNLPKKRQSVLWLGTASMPSTSAMAGSLCSQATPELRNPLMHTHLSLEARVGIERGL